MKILLLGDASNYHRSLSVGLRRRGHDVTVASNGSSWMNTSRDIDISRADGKLSGALLWLRLNTVLASRLKGYDVVQVHSPIFVDLRPNRVNSLFRRLRRDNGAVFLTALGTDSHYVDMCTASDCPLRYSEFTVGNYLASNPNLISDWTYKPLFDHTRYVYDNVDGVITALYEYHQSCLRQLPADKVAYAGIPVDTSAIEYNPAAVVDGCVNIMAACHEGREAEKGIDLMLPVLRELADANPGRMNLNLVQNVPFDEFKRTLARANIVVDQLFSYTPATTALMAMAAGKVVVSGAESEYYDFIGEKSLRPIINPVPDRLDALRNQIQTLIDRPQLLTDLSRQGRDFVVKHNDVDVVAKRFVDFWERRL